MSSETQNNNIIKTRTTYSCSIKKEGVKLDEEAPVFLGVCLFVHVGVEITELKPYKDTQFQVGVDLRSLQSQKQIVGSIRQVK